MNEISPFKIIPNNKKRNSMTQLIILNKLSAKKQIENENINSNIENESQNIDKSFKINKFSYYNVKKKCKIYFNQGRIYIKSDMDKNNKSINLSFYDTSSRLRIQGLIKPKQSLINIDNNENCVKINEIIGLIYYIDDNGNSKYDMMATNISIYLIYEDDLNNFFNSLN